MIRKIVFIHQDKAHLPEISAYCNFFSLHKYETIVTSFKNFRNHNSEFLEKSILWYFMGFYPWETTASAVINDYRSLSTGRFSRFKDFIKREFNHEPDLRIFLNENIKKIFNFRDNIPYLIINMGIPEEIEEYSRLRLDKEYDFIYTGAISFDRESNKVIENFINAYGNKKKLLMVGIYDVLLKKRYEKFSNIIFYGKTEQKRVFELIKKSEFALCIIPNKYPYNLQTPTKLLEYLALRAKIIVNRNPMILEILNKTGNYSKAYIIEANYRFPLIKILNDLQPTTLNVEEYTWNHILNQSGILNLIKQF